MPDNTARMIEDRFRHVDYRFLLPTIARLPRALAYAVADFRGRIYFRLRTDSRHHAEKNLSETFPLLSDAEVKARVRRSFEILSRDEMETFWYRRSRSWLERFVDSTQLEKLRRALSRNRGVLLFSGHFGSMGLFFSITGKHGIPLNIVGRSLEPDENPLHRAQLAFNRWRVKQIEREVERPFILTGRGNYPQMLERLQQGEIVMLLIDVPPNLLKRTVAVDFLGRRIRVGDGTASLYKASGAELLFWFMHWDRTRKRQSIKIEEVTPEVWNQEDPAEIMQVLMNRVEKRVLQVPDHWGVWDSLTHFVDVAPPPRESAQSSHQEGPAPAKDSRTGSARQTPQPAAPPPKKAPL